jgi:hypothetical protein
MSRSLTRLVQWSLALIALSGTAGATPIAGNSSIAGVGVRYEGNDHAFVAQTDGSIREIYFRSGVGASSDVLANIPGVVAISAFATVINYPNVGLRDRIHIIVGTKSGDLFDVYYSPGLGVHQYLLTHLTSPDGGTIQALAAWAGDPTVQSVAILTTDGDIFQFSYSDITAPATPPTLFANSTASAITGYAEADLSGGLITNHLVFLDTDLIDVSWPEGDAPDLNSSMTVVSTLQSGGPGFTGFVGISGSCRYYRIHDMINLAPTFSGAGTLQVVDYTNFDGVLSTPAVRANGTSVTQPVAIASYVELSDDVLMHVISLDASGNLTDQVNTPNSGEVGTWTAFALGSF